MRSGLNATRYEGRGSKKQKKKCNLEIEWEWWREKKVGKYYCTGCASIR